MEECDRVIWEGFALGFFEKLPEAISGHSRKMRCDINKQSGLE